MANYVLGKGKVYIDELDGNGNKTGEFFFGNAPGFEVSVESESLDHYSSTGGIREKDEEVTTQVTRSGTITVDDISAKNLALFIVGEISTISQTATPVANEAITVKQGLTYQLGTTTNNPAGVRGVGSVVVTDVAGTTTFDVTDDYTVDATLGRITIVAGGAIASSASQTIHVDYTPVAQSREQIATGALGSKTVSLRYIADNPKGTNRDLYSPKVTMRPSGALPFIGEEWLSMQFELEFLSTAATAAIYIDGRPA
jgi:hypothetical protein